jgi:uncharacterized protein (TIGR02271 family)
MRWDRNSVQEGMIVTSTTGDRVGKVIRCDAETFVVEKGALFPKDYQLRYDHITGTSQDGALIYSLTDYSMVDEIEREQGTTAAAAATFRAGTETAQDHEVRIPLLKEELDIEKFAFESGRVRIHKGVKIEERHFTVPVRREEVVVEHVPTTAWASATAASATSSSTAFQEQDLDIPLFEEDIRVGKHSVVREEVVVRTVVHAVDVEGSTSLRSEEAEIEDTRRRPAASMSASGGDGTSGGYGAPGRH